MVLKKSTFTCDSDDIVVAAVDVIKNDFVVALAALDIKKEDPENLEPLFRTIDIPGKGQGIIATKKIFPGDVIFAEKPLIIIPDAIFYNADDCEDFIEKEVNKMSCSDRERLLSLSDCRTNNQQYAGMVYTNAMDFDGDAAICPMIARANHSCRPNAEFVTRSDLGKKLLVAMYVIQEGEEICINYMDMKEEGTDTRDVRQEKLIETWGFRCCCFACTLQVRVDSKLSILIFNKVLNTTSKDKSPQISLTLIPSTTGALVNFLSLRTDTTFLTRQIKKCIIDECIGLERYT